MARVSVIVPARNAAATLPRCLEALARQELSEPYEVVVVDNGSSDGTAELAEAAPGPVRVLRQANRGPAVARNRGVAACSAPALAFTDADCFPSPGWLAAGLLALERAELVQGRVVPDPAAPRGPFSRSLWVTSDAGLYQTANLLVTRRAFERAGGFEPWFSPDDDRPFGEDVVFGWRVRRAGGRATFAPDALVHHAVLPGRPRDLLAERRREGLFVGLVRRVPELRRTFLFAGLFVDSRRAAFDAAVAAAALALLARSPLALAAAIPYALRISRRWRPWRPARARAAGVEVVGDALGLSSLAHESLRQRTVVL